MYTALKHLSFLYKEGKVCSYGTLVISIQSSLLSKL